MLAGGEVPAYPRGAYPEYEVWDKVAEDWWWADRFNWTPAQVDDLPVDTYVRLRHIDNMAAEIRRAKAKG